MLIFWLSFMFLWGAVAGGIAAFVCHDEIAEFLFHEGEDPYA
jgi:hypothetical protein